MAIPSILTSSSASASSSSSPSPSPTATSSPTLSSPSTTTTTPASHCSPSAKDIAVHNGLFSLGDSNTNSNHHSIFEDHDPALPRGINILNRHSSISHHTDGISDPFGLSDYFSSSVPKANLASSNSIHIGSLSNGLSGLSLAAQGLNNNNTNNSNNLAAEEISTIFVVGFPEDMHEREFQNMFVFTPGFEAATLKIPQREQQEDDALTLGVNGVNPRKQIIGFAKFRSHQEAQQAIAVLSGRRVDAEKGSLLKAEMAKKNLHTRRGLSNELVATPGPSLTSSWAPSAPIGSTSIHPVNIAKKVPHPLQHRNSLAGSAAYDAFHSVPCSPALPSDLLSPNDYASSYDFYADVYAPNNISNLSFAESFGGRHQQALNQQQQQQSSDISSSFLGRQNAYDMRVDPLSMGSFSNNIGGLAGSISGSFSSSFSNRHGGLAGSQRLNKSFLDMDETPTSTMAFLSKSIPAHTERGFNNALFNNTSNSNNGDDMGNGRFQGMPISTAAPSMPSPAMASPGFRTPVNPGDQNPPCNTLYVGNLPMNTSEDELRTLFSRCVGYRRLCFRTKSNGPMCFVEFENVECATQALNDLYGNPLSNSVKGGIRLSFSKNPLGVRNSTVNQSSGLANQLHNMNGSGSYLDRRDSMTAMFEQHY
ncbi:hypothetical protein BGX29_009586 [Mortierella sp. GBA35]|nr:hypothetical protein BGX23_012430 [Mortierella sp. AD031]KAF9106430.1 hypothetical protein BGX29_009586 [Mortierella sp. GBA35]